MNERHAIAARPMSSPLPSYIRARRKQWQLSQREVAFLLGLNSQSGVSQHESVSRVPQLSILLKYEALFGPLGELYPRLQAKAEADVARQLDVLIEQLENRAGATAANKLRYLRKLKTRLAETV